MSPFDQSAAECRCEWGAHGIEQLAAADAVIIVDILSFSTCVDVALSRGGVILPYPYKDDSAAEFARTQRAELAGRRGEGYSLSPASFIAAPAGLRCVLPSPNGATLTLQAATTAPAVFAGCLRNATAVAKAAQARGRTVNVIPAGERWPDGSLRPAIEDWIAAGAILAALSGTKSPEAQMAIATFEAAKRDGLPSILAASASGRELIERGFSCDVELAGEFDVSMCVPRFVSGELHDEARR